MPLLPPAFLLAALLIAAASPARAQQPPPPAAEERAVLAVVQRFFDTMRVRDTAGMRRLFDPGARLVGVRTRPSGEAVMQVLTVSDFVAFVGRDARARWTERAWDPEVRVSGTLATVWAEYDFHFGTQFSHCGVDAVQLLKLPERGWVIVSIADTYVKDGCPVREAPKS
jgi:hypothetical protein